MELKMTGTKIRTQIGT
jgi:hypothetical protein